LKELTSDDIIKSLADEIENTSESDGTKYIKTSCLTVTKPIFKARRDIEKYIK
jgi:hypothetical protein